MTTKATLVSSIEAAAKKAGRRYPNLIDNMRAAQEQRARKGKARNHP